MILSFSSKSGLWAGLIISSALLLGALGFEHIGGMTPCTMCYWQRHAHRAVIVCAGLGLIIGLLVKNKPEKWDRVFVLMVGLAFLVSFGLAFWHMGVEYKWWEGPKTCAIGAGGAEITADDIFEALEGGVQGPACGDVPWSFFGVSMAGYNALISLGAALLSFSAAFKRQEV